MKKISFVIPCYRSERTIEKVIDDIKKTIKGLDYSYEIICVDDSSPDNVFGVLKNLCKEDINIKAIRFAKNFGQHAGMIAGLRHATGDYVVFLDDDGQCPIENLEKMIQPISGEWDISIAKYGKKKQSAFKNFGSWVHETVANLLIDKPADIQMSNFIAVKKFVADEISRYEGPYPHITGLIFRSNSRIINVPMEENSRKEGESTYSIRKLLSLWVNSFTAFSMKPLRFATFVGLFFAFFGIVYGIVIVFRYFFVAKTSVLGWSSMIVITTVMGGLILFVLGIMGEYIGRIYMSVNQTPQYVIAETSNINKDGR